MWGVFGCKKSSRIDSAWMRIFCWVDGEDRTRLVCWMETNFYKKRNAKKNGERCLRKFVRCSIKFDFLENHRCKMQCRWWTKFGAFKNDDSESSSTYIKNALRIQIQIEKKLLLSCTLNKNFNCGGKKIIYGKFKA